LHKINPQVDEELGRLLDRCLAFEPEDRPQSAEELASALRKCLSAPRRLRRWAAARPKLVVGSILFALFVSLSGAASFAFQEPFSKRRLEAAIKAYQMGDTQRGVKECDRAIEADPKYHQAWFVRGWMRKQLGAASPGTHESQSNFAEAAVDFRTADQLFPMGVTKACLGYCRNQYGEHHPEAKLHYLNAIQAGFGTPEVFNNLGYTFLRLNLDADYHPRAEENLTAALDLNGNLQAAYHNRARVALEWARKNPHYVPVTGIADIERALRSGPITADLYADAFKLYLVAMMNDRKLKEATSLLLTPDACTNLVRLGLERPRWKWSWRDRACECLGQAMELGLDPKRELAGDVQSKPVKTDPKFAAVLAHPVKGRKEALPTLLLDPLPILPDLKALETER
jgi:hypothetical protein